MSESIKIREGITSSIEMQLLSDGVVIDLTNCDHIEMKMMDTKGKVYSYSSLDSSAISIVTAASGLVDFTPPDTTIFSYARQPYSLYWWVYPTSGDSTTKYAVPGSDVAIIKVLKDY